MICVIVSIPFQGLSSFLEEGRYPDLSTFPNLEGKEEMKPGSVKFMPEDLGSPEISLYSSSSFAGRMTDSWATHIPTSCRHKKRPYLCSEKRKNAESL